MGGSIGRRGEKKNLRKGIWGKTIRIKRHLEDSMKTIYSINFLKHIHIYKDYLMKSPSIGGDQVSNGFLFSPMFPVPALSISNNKEFLARVP